MASLAWQGAWLLWDGRSWGEAVKQARARAAAKQWGPFSGSKGSPGHDVAALYFDDGEVLATTSTVANLNPPGSLGAATYERFTKALAKSWEKLAADGKITPAEIAEAKAKAQTDAKAEIPIVVLVIAIVYVFVNTAVDLAYGLADPRIRRA